MKIFKEFNQSTECKICKTNKNGEAVLIPKYETAKDGNVECEQVHLECLDLQWVIGDAGNSYYIVQEIERENDNG